jgi:hypothetical protein
MEVENYIRNRYMLEVFLSLLPEFPNRLNINSIYLIKREKFPIFSDYDKLSLPIFRSLVVMISACH